MHGWLSLQNGRNKQLGVRMVGVVEHLVGKPFFHLAAVAHDQQPVGQQSRHGKVVAVLVSPSAVASPRTAAMRERTEQLRIMLAEARKRPLTQVQLGPERTAELIEDVYASRLAR